MGVPHAVTQGPKLPPASGPILGGTETLGHGAHIYLSAAWQWPSALMPVSSQPDPVSWAQPGGGPGDCVGAGSRQNDDGQHSRATLAFEGMGVGKC